MYINEKHIIGILGIIILISIFPIFNINAEGLSKPSGTSPKPHSIYMEVTMNLER